MDDPQDLEHRRHWQELAAQLGLDPGAEPAPVSPAHARAEPARKPVMEAPVPEVTNEPAPADIDPWSPPGMEAPPEEPREAPHSRQGNSHSADEVPAAKEATPEPEAAAGEADDRPRRGRRRGRRPSPEEGGAAETQGEQPGGEDQPVAEETERSSEASRRRGRGR